MSAQEYHKRNLLHTTRHTKNGLGVVGLHDIQLTLTNAAAGAETGADEVIASAAELLGDGVLLANVAPGVDESGEDPDGETQLKNELHPRDKVVRCTRFNNGVTVDIVSLDLGAVENSLLNHGQTGDDNVRADSNDHDLLECSGRLRDWSWDSIEIELHSVHKLAKSDCVDKGKAKP